MKFDLLKRNFLLLTQKRTPRWLVLLIDIFIVVFSFMTATISYNMHTGTVVSAQIIIGCALCVIMYCVVALLFHSYAFVIKLSATDDLMRLYTSLCAMALGLGVINFIIALIFKTTIMSYWVICLTCIFTAMIISAERLMVKYIYAQYIRIIHTRKKVIIYGTTINSLLIAASLKGEAHGSFEPVALTYNSDRQNRKIINNLPVLPFDEEKLKEYIENNKVEALIIPDEYARALSDENLCTAQHLGIKLLTINQVDFDMGSDEASTSNGTLSRMLGEVKIEDLLGREPIRNDNKDVRSIIKGNTVLVTGACGSIGSEIARQVADYGVGTLVLVDQAETPMHDLMLELNAKFPDITKHYFVGDVKNLSRMEQAVSTFRPSIILHAAAYKHVPMMEMNPTEAILTNVGGTRNMADLAVKYNVEKFVMVSTDKAVNPTNVMGATKRMAEIYTQSLAREREINHNTQFITTRFGNVLGSNGSVIPLFRKQIAAGGPVTVTHRNIIRYFMTIPEACSLVLKAACIGKSGYLYIFDMGKPVKIWTLAERMIRLSGYRPYEDIDIVEVGLRPGEKLYEELLHTAENTTPTEHRKIFIGKSREYAYADALKATENCLKCAASGDEVSTVKAMKEFITEFKSNNSRFESLDK